MNSNENKGGVESGTYFLHITDGFVSVFNKKKRYILQPIFSLVGDAYRAVGNGGNKRVKNPNVGEYEGFRSSVPRYGWPDNNGAVWVPCCLTADYDQLHWNIEGVDGSHEIFFPIHGVSEQKDNCALVAEDSFLNLDTNDLVGDNKNRLLNEDKNESCVVLVGKDIMMYSPKDEDAFFEWVAKIECIAKIAGVGSEIYFYIIGTDIFASDFDDIYGLFSRYGIDREQLRVFHRD